MERRSCWSDAGISSVGRSISGICTVGMSAVGECAE
jgi:hypothetical protein